MGSRVHVSCKWFLWVCLGSAVRLWVTLGCVQRSVRFPDELAERIVAEAARLDRSFSWVVVRVLEQALAGSSTAELPPASGGFSAVGGSTPSRLASARASEPPAPSVEDDGELPVVPLPKIAGRHWAS